MADPPVVDTESLKTDDVSKLKNGSDAQGAVSSCNGVANKKKRKRTDDEDEHQQTEPVDPEEDISKKKKQKKKKKKQQIEPDEAVQEVEQQDSDHKDLAGEFICDLLCVHEWMLLTVIICNINFIVMVDGSLFAFG